MNITLNGIKITQDNKTLAFEKNNDVDEIVVTVDTDESWSYKLDVKYPDKYNTESNALYNIIDLDRNGNTCSVTLNSGMLPFNGKYTMQLRGISGDKVYHSDIFEAWVKYSIEPGSTYDPVPSEFYQIENKLDDKANEAKQYADEAKQSATDAHTAKTAAETAMDAAVTAQNKADAAQKGAEDAKSEAEASEEASASNAATAMLSAQNAKDSEDAAKASEDNAAQSATDAQAAMTAAQAAQSGAEAAQSAAEQSAQQAAESAAVYDTVVADVTQLKQDITAITPDDTTVDGKPWTSKKIVDTICQPFEESGNPVQCYPVENYPLGVKASWEPVQEGSGDPSPDNIRPITGRDAVSVTRCGKNLVDFPHNIKVSTLANASKNYSVELGGIKDVILQWKFTGTAGNTASCLSIRYNDGSSEIVAYWGNSIGSKKITKAANRLTLSDWTGLNGDMVIEYVQIEPGDTATPYEPYTGSTTGIALPETVYGGTLDVESGVVTVTHCFVTLTGDENWGKEGNYIYAHLVPIGKLGIGVCTHYPYWNGGEGFDYNAGNYVCYRDWAFIVGGGIGLNFTVDEWKAHLAEQKANGTQVQVSYALKTPYTIQLTPQQIAALSGANTIYTDADGVVVTGAEDPKHTITELKNAIISLGGNV